MANANDSDSSDTKGKKTPPSPSPSLTLVAMVNRKIGQPQLWAPEATEIYLSGRTPDLTSAMRSRLQTASRLSVFDLRDTLGSWNISQCTKLAAACGGHISPLNALTYFLMFLESQVHNVDTGHLSYLTGSETLSADYWPLQWGAVCGVSLWIQKSINSGDISTDTEIGPARKILSLCRQYHAICIRTALLLSHTQDGKLYVSPVSERSNEWSDGNVNPMVELFLNLPSRRSPANPKRYTRSIDWPVRFARQCQRPSAQEIASAPLPRLWAPIHRAEWADGTILTYKPSMQNHNTLSYLAEVWRPDGTRELLYPWPSGRAFDILGMSEVSRLADGNLKASWKWQGKGDGEDWTEGETIISLPKTPPTRCFVLGPDGYAEDIW